MATDIRSLPAINDSAAVYRTWAQGIDAQLLACGLVATSDTGQVDLATLTQPTSGGQYVGYRMYRFNDALQATKPIILKVSFGLGATANRLALGLQVGSTTNGAGTFTGVAVGTAWAGGGSLNPSAGSVRDSYCSGSMADPGQGRIHIVTVFDPGTQYSTSFVVERLKGGDGTAHDSGSVFCGFLSGQASNQVRAQILTPGVGATGVDDKWAMIALQPNVPIQQPNVGTDLALSPLMYCLGVWLYGLPLSYRDADLTRNVPFTMTHLGASHTLMPFGPNLSTFGIPAGSSVASIALPWE